MSTIDKIIPVFIAFGQKKREALTQALSLMKPFV